MSRLAINPGGLGPTMPRGLSDTLAAEAFIVHGEGARVPGVHGWTS